MSNSASLAGKNVLITGANRGIGRALVTEALERGARRVYAGTRSPFSFGDARVVRVEIDLNREATLTKAGKDVSELDVLINNAGVAILEDLMSAATLQASFDVNVFGPLRLVTALLPQLQASKGAVVNVLSTTALAPMPIVPSYSASKAAAFSMTLSLRAQLQSRGVRFIAALPGPVDTEMSKSLNAPKASPQSVAQRIFDGLARGEDEIFPDVVAETLARPWRESAMRAQTIELAQMMKG